MNTADQLISGYTAYTTSEELGASSESEAPATAITSTVSTVACGVSLASVGLTWYWGC